MKLRELLSGVSVLACTADMEMEISGVSYDSRSVRPGDLFVAMTGFAVDGHKFIAAAQEKGAAAALCQKEPGGRCRMCGQRILAAHWQSSGPTGSAIPLRK